jgi:uncharacterized protein RhaS with RHS repeats
VGESAELKYNLFRWYRAGWGRYTQADPIDWKGLVNPYSYAEENPLRYIDPDGRRVLDRDCARRVADELLVSLAGMGGLQRRNAALRLELQDVARMW